MTYFENIVKSKINDKKYLQYSELFCYNMDITMPFSIKLTGGNIMPTICKEVAVHMDKKANLDFIIKEEEYSVLLNGNYDIKRYKIGNNLDIIIASANSRNLQSFAIYTKPKNKFFGEKYIGTIVKNEKDYNQETLLIKGENNHWMQLHSYE